MKPNYVYHWTHRKNLRSILKNGLLTEMSTGRLAAVWCCEYKRVAWALMHAAHTHGWEADDLVCISIQTRGVRLTRSAQPRVYCVKENIHPLQFKGVLMSVCDGFHDMEEIAA